MAVLIAGSANVLSLSLALYLTFVLFEDQISSYKKKLVSKAFRLHIVLELTYGLLPKTLFLSWIILLFLVETFSSDLFLNPSTTSVVKNICLNQKKIEFALVFVSFPIVSIFLLLPRAFFSSFLLLTTSIALPIYQTVLNMGSLRSGSSNRISWTFLSTIGR